MIKASSLAALLAAGPLLAAPGQGDPAAPESAAVEAGPIKVLHQPPPPPYPALAKLARIQGTVVVEVTIDARGIPSAAHAIEGPAPLRQVAEEYAKAWTFAPVVRNGVAVPARFKLTMPFSLQAGPPEASRAASDEAGLLAKAGRAAYERQAFLQSAATLARALDLRPGDASLWNDLGRAYLGAHAYPRAVEALQRAVRLDPKNPYAWNNLGLALVRAKRDAEAETAFRKQIEVSPEDRFAHRNLGGLLERTGRPREAIPEFEAAARIQPRNAAPLLGKGDALADLGDEKGALEAFARALDLESSPAVLNSAAYGLAKVGLALDHARTWAVKAIAETDALLGPGSHATNPDKRLRETASLISYWDTLGWVLFRQGDLKGALAFLEPAARMAGSPEALDHLGQALESLGDRPGAIQAYARELVLEDPVEGARERLARLAGPVEAQAALARARQAGSADLEVALPASGMEPGTTEFDAILAGGGKMVEARIRSGLEALGPLGQALLEVRHPFEFPGESGIRLAVRVRISLGRGSGTATARFLDARASGDPSALGTLDQPLPALIPPSMTRQWLEWAGPEGAALGFTPDRIQAFLEAQRASVATPPPAAVLAWLKDLSEAPVPSLSAWALARRLELGDFAVFGAYEKRMFDHIYGISKLGSGRAGAVLQDPPGLARALAVDPGSPFWAAFLRNLRSHLDAPMDAGLYAVWCYGTQPWHRDVILEEAGRVTVGMTAANPHPDPWNDPRFWIVVDWALAWGKPADFDALEKALPDGRARYEFQRIRKRVEALPAFWGFTPPPSRGAGRAAPPDREGAPEPSLKAAPFSPLKVKAEPTKPDYPDEAKGRRMMTNLVLDLTVGEDGKPLGAKLLPGPWLAFFGPTAYSYGMAWRFEPSRVDGVPQAEHFRLTVAFGLTR